MKSELSHGLNLNMQMSKARQNFQNSFKAGYIKYSTPTAWFLKQFYQERCKRYQ